MLPVFGLLQVNSKARMFHLPSGGSGRCCIAEGEGTMPVGKVKFFNTQKGFGFIQPDDGTRDVFVHISAVERAGLGTLNEGDKVSYELVTERGKQAAGNLARA